MRYLIIGPRRPEFLGLFSDTLWDTSRRAPYTPRYPTKPPWPFSLRTSCAKRKRRRRPWVAGRLRRLCLHVATQAVFIHIDGGHNVETVFHDLSISAPVLTAGGLSH